MGGEAARVRRGNGEGEFFEEGEEEDEKGVVLECGRTYGMAIANLEQRKSVR